MNGIWLRAGITLRADDKTLHEIVSGNHNALKKALSEGNWEFDGESYIPEISIEDYIKSTGDKSIEVGEVEFTI